MFKIFVFTVIFYFSIIAILFPQSGANITTSDSKIIMGITENVFNALTDKDASKITPYLYNGMRINSLTSDELRDLTLNFIDDKINEFSYRIKMSGNNLAFFLKSKNKIFVSYELSKPIYVSSIIGNDGKKINYYFLYARALYQNLIEDEEGNVSLTPVEIQIEIQIAKIRNKFNIIGFII